MDRNYCLLVKTGDAELRCLSNTPSSTLNAILPIIELTRGRKIRGKEKYPIENRLEKVYNIFNNQPLCIDLTSHPKLICDEIRELFNPADGYKNWRDLIDKIKESGAYSELIPCIQSNYDDDKFEDNYRFQAEKLIDKYNKIAYRSSLKEDWYCDDMDLIEPYLKLSDQLLFIIDCEYIPSGGWRAFADKAVARINNVYKILGKRVKFTICATSYPNNVSEIGKDDKDTFQINEIDLYEDVKKRISPDINFMYGDYGSISPKRNDDIIMAKGWVPRIDVPTQTEIYYVRERKNTTRDFANTYTFIAKEVMKDKRFPHSLSCWGIEQIKLCADYSAPGSSPSFWISVRMNIHIAQQLNRLT